MRKLLLTLALVFFAVGTWAQNLVSTVTQDNVTYELYDNATATMTKHSTPEGGTLVIPETVTHEGVTYTVTKIADKAISEGEARKVIVKAKVKSIGAVQINGSFRLMTSVEEIELPETLERIEDYQFCFTKLKSIEIPKSVKYIGVEAFNESSIETIVIPEGIETLEMGVFGRCSKLKSVTLPKSLKTIKGEGYITFSETNKRHCDSPFYCCTSLEEIVIPDAVESIDDIAFYGCNAMKRFVVNNNPTFYSDGGVLMQRLSAKDGGGIKLLQYPSSREGTEYTVPEGVTALGERAFYWYQMENLKMLNLPGTLKCVTGLKGSKLESINIAEGPTEIAAGAFEEAQNIHTLTLPSTISKIGSRAFYNTDLQRIFVKSKTPPTLDLTNVYGGKYDVMFCVDANLLNRYKNTDGWKAHRIVAATDIVSSGNLVYLKLGSGKVSVAGYQVRPTDAVAIPASTNSDGVCAVTAIEDKAFRRAKLTSVTIPVSVESIGEDAFYFCESLKTCEFAPDSKLQSIARAAFGYDDWLGQLALPATLRTIGEYAFCACTALKSVTFGTNSALESVGYDAFSYCRSLKHIELGAMVKLSGADVFEDCYDLESFGLDANNPYYVEKDHALFIKDGKTLVVNAPGGDYKEVYFVEDGLRIELFNYNYLKPKSIYVLSKTLPVLLTANNNGDYGTGYYRYAKGYVRESLVDDLKYSINYHWPCPWGNLFNPYEINSVPDDEADNMITGIDAPQVSEQTAADGAYYTLDGKRTDSLRKGIYIHNGRKVVVK